MNKNLLLIVMPVFNSEQTLGLAIQSILDQKHKNFILAIVDDCSTDSSLSIAKSFMSDPRVMVYKNKLNMGAYYSRNLGVYVNKDVPWKFFTTHDADDISYPNRYSTILRMLSQKHVNAVQDTFERLDWVTGESIETSLTMAHAVFKRSVFDFIGYFDNVRFGGDWEYWARLRQYNIRNSLTTDSLHETMGKSYIHGQNLTVTVPIGSAKRRNYVKKVNSFLKRINSDADLFRDFVKTPKISVAIKTRGLS
jgi:glycosyltransferase involved in cell wall biosynthesis